MNISLIESSNAFGLKTEGIPCGNGHINSTFTAEKDGEQIPAVRSGLNVSVN